MSETMRLSCETIRPLELVSGLTIYAAELRVITSPAGGSRADPAQPSYAGAINLRAYSTKLRLSTN